MTDAMIRKMDLKEVKQVIAKNGAKLQQTMQRNANFKGHFEGNKFVPPTGTTKRSISLEIIDGGLTAKVAPGTHYSVYLEYGTRYMSAQPFVKP
jgi:HK97 gp10 family phage protein